jgi:hypothetical protein
MGIGHVTHLASSDWRLSIDASARSIDVIVGNPALRRGDPAWDVDNIDPTRNTVDGRPASGMEDSPPWLK